MKRILRMLTSFSLALALLFTCAACLASDGGGGGGGGGGTGNELFGGNRPNYDDMFDYDSGYVQPDLNPDKMITLTMDSASPVKFTGGSNTLVIKTRSKLELSNFDLSGLAEQDVLTGLAEKSKDGLFTKARDLENYAVPYDDVTVLPYFNAPEGYADVVVGSGTGNKYNAASTSGSFKTSGTLTYIENAIVAGGTDYKPQKGGIISEKSKVDIDSAFRLDSTFDVVADTVYEFVYNFQNFGDKAAYFNLYQVSGGTNYAGRYRIDVDLKSGESATFTGQYKLGKNSNFLTYMMADDDMDSVKLGISMAAKATELKDPETENGANKNTLTLVAESGLTFEDGTTEKSVLEGDPIPKVIGMPAGYAVAGWYNPSKPTQFWNATAYDLRDKGTSTTGAHVDTFKMPARRTTIAPFFVKDGFRPLIAASGNGIDNIVKPDVATRSTVLFDTEQGKQIGTVINYTAGAYDSTAKTGIFRLSTNCSETSSSTGFLKAGKHQFYFTFVNMGDKDLKFSAHQVIGTMNLIPGVETGALTLKPGESWSGMMEVTLTGANNNALTVIKVLEAVEDAKLGVMMWKNPTVVA